MKIGIDLDGVVVDTYRHTIKFYNSLFKSEIGIEEFPAHTKMVKYLIGTYSFEEEQAKKYWYDNMLQIFSEARPLEGATETINKLSQDHEVYFISAREDLPGVREVTERWLADNDIVVDNNLFLTQGSKGIFAKNMGIDLFIEDAPHHIKSLVHEGIEVFIMRTSYNINTIYNSSCYVTNWNQILSKVEELCPNYR
ncbi:5' nucleotidase, NT5C type [Priestia megaterium]|uniref:5' nucleotidase, NT5C type n=1 Tax=Priestia megaterium TaxID=1404 RepID=UPI00164236CC|nr:hypothetical protein [Priestia megaterium]